MNGTKPAHALIPAMFLGTPGKGRTIATHKRSESFLRKAMLQIQ
jgi:hypothetical protein